MCDSKYCQCDSGSDFLNGKRAGHPVVNWPGWINNPARESINPDIQPLKIAPVHFTDWTARQVQLSNGWAKTNWGRRMGQPDHYLDKTNSSNSGTSRAFPLVLRDNARQATGYPGPSVKSLQQQISSRAPSDNFVGPGAGQLISSDLLKGRTYYG